MNLAAYMRALGYLAAEYDVDETIMDRLRRWRYRADVVATIPPSAPAGYLLVTPGDPNLYVGAGMGNPLRRIPTQTL